jgi:HAD superfamily hydrolase (TIGR01509 family)
MLCDLGLNVTLEDMFERFVGHSMAHCMLMIREALGAEVPVCFEADYHARTELALAELQSVPGVVDVLRGLTLPVCVASNGEPEKIRRSLGRTGLLERFEGRLFSAAAVARGKPAPDLFLHAAAVLGAAPARCVVVEDTSVGVTAGKAAGMTVFGYAGRTPAGRLHAAGADVVFSDMAELPGLIAQGASSVASCQTNCTGFNVCP